MIIIGFLLFAGAAVIGIDIAVTNSDKIHIDAFGSSFSTNTGSLVLAGAALALVSLLGAMLLATGLKRWRRNRRETQQLRDEHERLTATVEEERSARQNAEAKARAAAAQATAERPSQQDGAVDLRAGRV